MAKTTSTIRFRLTVWNSLVVLTAIFLAMFAARQGMKLSLEFESRELLQEEMNELELAVRAFFPDRASIVAEFERKIMGHSRHDWFGSIARSDGELLWQSDNFPPEFNMGVVPSPETGEGSTATLARHLVVRRRVLPDSRESLWLVLGEPTEFINRDVAQLTRTMLVIGAAFLILAPIGGYILARHAMLPVQRIVDTAQKLNPSSLEDRLPLRGNGDELDQISNEINKFLDLVSQYLAEQREFIANASHELRSPLTAIQTGVEVCLNKARSEAEYRDQLEIVAEQSTLLRRLVNQLLDLAEAESAAVLKGRIVDLGELVERSLSVFGGVADEKEIDLRFHKEGEALCQADPSRLIIVFNNLIDNAIKFTPPGGKIEIRLTRERNELLVSFSDSGPGVPDEMLQRIFDRFFQVDPARERTLSRGNGLGLSLCKSIVELHGGRIAAENRDGLTVTIRLPAEPPETSASGGRA